MPAILRGEVIVTKPHDGKDRWRVDREIAMEIHNVPDARNVRDMDCGMVIETF
ncbi:hypothetical protein [Herbiconiux sp. YIM B11900]|uniref:hypothetical protein n=1 Tax=Herbiconiux sp. YIM B11900 TaxID=3404131 RepID=UPI003F86CEE5